MPQIAIICSVIPERHSLLIRSIKTWEHSIQNSGLDAAICIWSEGCPVHELGMKLPPVNNLYLGGQIESSGSHIKGYDFWINNTDADVYLFTHPEMLFPTTTVKVAHDMAKDNIFTAFKVFWLHEEVTNQLNRYPWLPPEQLEYEDEVRKLDPELKGEFYWNRNVRNEQNWQTTATYAMNRPTLQRMLPFPDFKTWGPDDLWHAAKRRQLGIQDVTAQDPIVFHQHHPRIKGPDTWEQIINMATSAF